MIQSWRKWTSMYNKKDNLKGSKCSKQIEIQKVRKCSRKTDASGPGLSQRYNILKEQTWNSTNNIDASGIN